SKTTTTTHDVTDRRTMTGSELNGDTVSIGAGHNLNVTGSSVAGDNRVSLAAGNNLNIGALTESNRETHLKQEKKSGLMSSGGVGFSMGSQSLKVTDTATDTTQKGRTVGSVHGDVSLQAGNRLTVNGSDLIAGRDMALSGKEVSITAATDQHVQTHTVEQKTSGLTLALSGTAGSALNTTVETVQAAKSAGNSRLEALQGVKAALSGAQAVQAGRLAEAQGNQKENNNAVGISLSYGSQSSKSEQQSEQTVAKGSTLTAGNHLSIQATGSGVKGVDGDLTIQGSQIKAGNNVLLQANRDVNLVSAENTSKLEGKNTSSGGSVGVGVGVGSGGWGISVSASANQGKGSEKGNGTTHTETTVDAGKQLTIISGRDTTLTGAQAGGETVKVDAGRHLTLTSEQDSDRYDSKQQNASAGGSFTFGSMSGSASVSLSRDKMHSNYDSVQEQTGIFAGRGGFDVTTGQHTQLNGAVIVSTATADKNRLDTGTLGFSDIENRANFKTEHQSAGLSTGGSVAGNFLGNMANNLLVGANHEGHADSTTQSAVSAGNITIRDTQSQKQDVADLNRDAAHANQTLSPIFDREKEQQRLQQAQLIGEIGNQVADIARTEGQIAGEKAKRDPAALNQARAELEAAGKPFTEQDVAQRAYNNGMAASGFGTGGKYQQAIQAATAAVQGLAGGNLSAALAGGAAPYIAEIIKQTTPEGAGRVAAHAVVNAALSLAQGKNALAGAAGAATGEVVGMIATQMYGKPVSELSETEKQTVSTLATVAAGLAGGLVGDSGGAAVAGAQSGKTTVENNMLNVIATETAANTAAAIAGATGNASRDTGNDNSWDIGGGCEGSREQCAVRDPSRDGTRGPGHVLNGDNTDENKQPNLGKDVASATDKDKAELGGAGAGTPGGWGPDNEEKARHQEVQQQRFDELSKIYDKSHPVGELTVDGQTIRQSSVSNRYGTTKVFESQNLTDKQIHNYAQQLAGDTPLKEVRPGIYTAKLNNGTSITLRNLSSSQEQTGARWTIDIRGNQQLAEIAHKYGRQVEIKFR
ncbi:hemagglutinin repeat-containing protein, partial [Escherichia coli]